MLVDLLISVNTCPFSADFEFVADVVLPEASRAPETEIALLDSLFAALPAPTAELLFRPDSLAVIVEVFLRESLTIAVFVDLLFP